MSLAEPLASGELWWKLTDLIKTEWSNVA